METKINLPREVRVGIHRYKIIEMSPAEATAHGVLGLISTATQTIHLATYRGPAETADTLVHEIIHAICRSFNLPKEGVTEENTVIAISNGLVRVAQDHPDLWDWIGRAARARHWEELNNGNDRPRYDLSRLAEGAVAAAVG